MKFSFEYCKIALGSDSYRVWKFPFAVDLKFSS